MRLACIAFVAGAWLLQQQPELPASQWLFGFATLALAALLATRLAGSKISAKGPSAGYSIVRTALAGTAFVAFVALGFIWAAWRADLRLSDELPSTVEGRDLVLVGTVDSLPYLFDRGVRFDFSVESVLAPEDRKPQAPRLISLSWYSSGFASDDRGALRTIQPGERWRLSARLKKPHGNANPEGFDYEYWLLEQNLRATGYVRPSSADGALSNRRLDSFVWSFGHAVERMRALLRDRIVAALPDAPYAGVIAALVVGDQRSIGQSDWEIYNRTGIAHLISISGLHITMIAGLAAAAVFALWRRSPRLVFRLPAHKAAALAGALVALAYCLLAGFGVPAQRTLYMLGIVALALWLGRISSASRVLCAALLVVVLIDPWAVMGAGFWLSFCAVAAIFYVTAGRVAVGRVDFAAQTLTRWRDKARLMLSQGARIQWAVTLALMPLTMLLFHQVSLISPIANAIAIPLVSLVVTPLALAGALLSAPFPNVIGTLLLHAAHGLIAWLAALLGWMSAQSFAVWSGPAPSAWSFACAMIGVAWCLAPRGLPLRWLGSLWLVPLFAWPPDRPAAGVLRLTALDVGQGMAVLLETSRHTLLYDTGPQYSLPNSLNTAAENDDGNNAGNRVIVPYLRARGIERLDTMFVSHNDNDHSGGALSILAQFPVGEVISSLAGDSAIVARAGTRHQRCAAGQRWAVDGLMFEILHPAAPAYDDPRLKTNAKSCVLRIRLGSQSVLLPGDIETPQELELLARAGGETSPVDLHSEVLLVPHHGSLTSSSEAFLDAVHPRLALIQAGYRNRFGHPRPQVVQRYVDRGVQIERNDEDGAITVVLDGKDLKTEAYREAHRRYWYGN